MSSHIRGPVCSVVRSGGRNCRLSVIRITDNAHTRARQMRRHGLTVPLARCQVLECLRKKEWIEAWQYNRRRIRGGASLFAQVTRGALAIRNACRGEIGDLESGKPVLFSGRQGKVSAVVSGSPIPHTNQKRCPPSRLKHYTSCWRAGNEQ